MELLTELQAVQQESQARDAFVQNLKRELGQLQRQLKQADAVKQQLAESQLAHQRDVDNMRCKAAQEVGRHQADMLAQQQSFQELAAGRPASSPGAAGARAGGLEGGSGTLA
ncbi:hypothetical protein HaLaN_21150 [Haematococcus lacustris]|uniref:Uncharacterized protein n=1 Tax=Haematococcus lacustris TaxID=44745 RepID=A0A699ZL69_HAELA|nr:hypothetical protein HaLaN_21150 [Haematococcus lacustris]